MKLHHEEFPVHGVICFLRSIFIDVLWFFMLEYSDRDDG